ncbi:MAG: hypothetical protein LC663_01855 [Actinobacteria bacterium]|nr:hypothetical protein [Actinomycetota bacterium]
MRLAIALVIAVALCGFGIASLRSLVARGPSHAEPPPPTAPPPDVRITFRCENCGTELLVLRRGSETPPRHCGEPMIKREEVAHN